MSSSAASSSSPTLWMSPLGIATSGPPRSSFEMSSPVDSFTTGGPAVKMAPLAAHDPEVGDRGDERAMPGRGSEHRGDDRDAARTLGLGKQIGRGAPVVAAARPKAGALEHHHQRDSVADRELGDPVALGVAARPDAAGQGGEVLGADHHRHAVDLAGAGDDRVGRDLTADERADFAERARDRAAGRCARGRRACPCRGVCRVARARPCPTRADGDGRDPRASRPNPGLSTCFCPTSAMGGRYILNCLL